MRESVKKVIRRVFLICFMLMALFWGETGVQAAESASAQTCTVNFYNSNGGSSSAFKAISMTVPKGSKVKLPAVPAITGYQRLGWAKTKQATVVTNKVGTYVTIERNTAFYGVYKRVGTCKVVFTNNSGTTTSKTYQSMNKTVTRYSYITLPDLPTIDIFESLGWTTEKGGTKALYKPGERIRVTQNMKLYSVYRRKATYTVTFYLGNGSSNSTYKALTKKVLSGSIIVMPSVPTRSGYVNLGWTTRQSSSTVVKCAGARCRVTRNLNFYAVQKQAVKVTLCRKNGTVWKNILVGKGDYLKLPGFVNPSGSTMMGWSTRTGQSVRPTYEVGQTVKITKAIKLYAVEFDRRNEQDLSVNHIRSVNETGYDQIIFVGDSRTNRMRLTLERLSAGVTDGISFIAKEGGGLEWLKSEGARTLLNMVNGNARKKIAVIFNLGVNDLVNINQYISYMRSLGTKLKEKGCMLYYMSVNPVNNASIQAYCRPSRPEERVRSFNASIQNYLCSGSSAMYRYIDIYSWLMATGYGTDVGNSGADAGKDDGLHYTTKTYKRIYDQVLRRI